MLFISLSKEFQATITSSKCESLQTFLKLINKFFATSIDKFTLERSLDSFWALILTDLPNLPSSLAPIRSKQPSSADEDLFRKLIHIQEVQNS